MDRIERDADIVRCVQWHETLTARNLLPGNPTQQGRLPTLHTERPAPPPAWWAYLRCSKYPHKLAITTIATKSVIAVNNRVFFLHLLSAIGAFDYARKLNVSANPL